jgi:hypothetical protein
MLALLHQGPPLLNRSVTVKGYRGQAKLALLRLLPRVNPPPRMRWIDWRNEVKIVVHGKIFLGSS